MALCCLRICAKAPGHLILPLRDSVSKKCIFDIICFNENLNLEMLKDV